MKSFLFLDDSKARIDKFYEHMHVISKKSDEIITSKVVETSLDCIKAIQDEEWDLVSLDHDLGGEVFVNSFREDTGMEVARYISKYRPVIKQIIVHSWNIPAADLMYKMLLEAGYNVRKAPFTV